MRFPKLTADKLEQLGQLRLPGIDILRTLNALVQLVQDVKAALGFKKAALAPRITETARSISVRLDSAFLVVSGDDREFLDADTVRADLDACKSESDAIDMLVGAGFTCRMSGAGRQVPLDVSLLDDDTEFAFA